ncbi:MAG: T9SS type A sorting domain-containing protein, partial [Bacteroidales bacterium]|nr:T9SS type A sorting domain-containing protein [Bacteroidales bacterium]
LSPIDYVGGGQFDVKVYVNGIDSNAANDTAKFSLNLNPDLAVTGYDAIGFTEPGDTVYVGFTMKNTGNLEIVSPFDVKVVVNGVDTITELVTASLKPGDTLYYKFRQGVIVPMTTADQPYYLLDVYAQLSCDADGDNDSVRIIGNVNIVDNGILSIITPAAGQCAMGGEMAKVEVRLFNNGNVDNADSVTVTAVIDSAGAAYMTLTEKIAPMYGGENRNYTFRQQYRVPRLSVNGAQASYNVKVFLTALDGDIDLSSDTAKVEACVQGGVGIDDATADRWMVGQNVPNPATELTRIPYVIPEAGVLTLRIMGMNGQVLYREEVDAEAGSGDIRVNLSDLAAGVYYYSVEYRGERVVKKMNVTR